MTLMIDKLISPNAEPRKSGKIPRYLILHYTGCNAPSATTRFMDGNPGQAGGRLSTHYMVHENGHVTQFVDEALRAWHAGASYWRGETDLNSASIGIEIENLGEYADYPPFAEAQISALITLCQDILRRHPAVTPFNVLGHSDIAPGRKLDPGPKFPWARLASAGVGILPTDTDEYLMENDRGRTLAKIGYNPKLPVETCYHAFCAHYAPEGLGELGLAAADFKLWALAKMVNPA